jgi:hypothetical protein
MTPSPSLTSIKRRADELTKEGFNLTEALKRASKEAGFASYQIASNKLRNKR